MTSTRPAHRAQSRRAARAGAVDLRAGAESEAPEDRALSRANQVPLLARGDST